MELIDRFAERGLLDSVLHDVRSGKAACWSFMVIRVLVSRR